MTWPTGFFKSLLNKWKKRPDNIDSSKNKTYIYDEESDYYDHLEPKLMSGQEIDNMPMEIENREQPQSQGVIIDTNTGKQSALDESKISQLKNRGNGFVIPGQVIREKDGTVKKVPLRTDVPVPGQVPKFGNQQPQAHYPQHPQAPYYPQPETVPVGEVVYNIFKLEDASYLFIELPGADKSSVDVQISDRNVTVSCEYLDYAKIVNEAEMVKKEAKKKKNYVLEHKSNVSKSKFSNTYGLPASIKEDEVIAKFENGVLELYLPYRSVEHKKVGVTVL